MAKRPKLVGGTAGQDLAAAEQTEAPAAEPPRRGGSPPATPEPAVDEVLVRIPLAGAAAPITRHIDGHLNHGQAVVMRELVCGLDLRGERLANGRRVQSSMDAVRWVLEQLADGGAE